jgi:hypothetical protein
VANAITAVVRSVLIFGEGAPEGHSLEGFAPPNPENFGAWVQVFIGEQTEPTDSSDSFDLLVCTPSWMAAKVQAGEWRFLKNHD